MKDKPQGLSVEQIEFVCHQVRKWMDIADLNSRGIGPTDVDHSALLRRLLSGKLAHPEPPPKRFGYPAWELVEFEDRISIDQHEGYSWLDKEQQIIQYERLKLKWQIITREVIPDASVVKKGLDPAEFKYTAKFLKKLPKS
jgi:hypothetical protein